MFRKILMLVLASLLSSSEVLAQEIQRGKLKKLDVERQRVVITVGGQDREFRLTEQTHVFGATGKELAERLRDFQAGADVLFKPGRGDAADTLVGIKRAGSPSKPATGLPRAPRRGTIKQVDSDRRVVTIAVSGQDHDFVVTDRTQIRDVAGGNLSEQIKQLATGTQVQFLAEPRGDRQVLVALRPAQAGVCPGTRVSPDTSRLKPLGEMGDEKYQRFPGGLYPEGRNTRPQSHEAAGMRLARQVRPLDAQGQTVPLSLVRLQYADVADRKVSKCSPPIGTLHP